MAVSPLSLIKRFDEFCEKGFKTQIPKYTRGLYVLLDKRGNAYNVVYVGMAGGDKAGIGGRLNSHARSTRKKKKWTHFSIFEVHDNITRETIQELEGLFRHIYRKDTQTLKLGKHKRFKRFKNVQRKLRIWKS